jgi:hypothetical protein
MDEVTATQAAALCGYSERTIRRRIASGDLQARRIASNRYAIRVSDLPRRHGADTLAQRVEALEQQVRQLELQLQSVQGPRGQDGAASTPVGDQQVSLSTLQDLLLQLAQETERLAPLLAEPVTAASAADQRRQGRGRS